ncbi:MAG: DUF86 domain-containing protein [Chloroflexi bacterium]|nr:DUF86 domain-containing protein [Chloroflexota bacterium]
MSQKRPEAYLEDIHREAEQIKAFVRDMASSEFLSDVKTQYAVRLALAHIGEAVKRLPASLTDQHSNIPWKQIAGMRDRLVHEYATVDVEIVWRAATVSVPELAAAVNAMLQGEKQ